MVFGNFGEILQAAEILSIARIKNHASCVRKLISSLICFFFFIVKFSIFFCSVTLSKSRQNVWKARIPRHYFVSLTECQQYTVYFGVPFYNSRIVYICIKLWLRLRPMINSGLASAGFGPLSLPVEHIKLCSLLFRNSSHRLNDTYNSTHVRLAQFISFSSLPCLPLLVCRKRKQKWSAIYLFENSLP